MKVLYVVGGLCYTDIAMRMRVRIYWQVQAMHVTDAVKGVGERMFSGLMSGIMFLLAVLLAVFLVMVLISLLRWRCHEMQVRKDKRKEDKLKYTPDGRACPPLGRSLCENCRQVKDQVYHLPDGSRICINCFRESSLFSEAPAVDLNKKE